MPALYSTFLNPAPSGLTFRYIPLIPAIAYYPGPAVTLMNDPSQSHPGPALLLTGYVEIILQLRPGAQVIRRTQILRRSLIVVFGTSLTLGLCMVLNKAR